MDVLGFKSVVILRVKYARRQLSGRLKYLKRSGPACHSGRSAYLNLRIPTPRKSRVHWKKRRKQIQQLLAKHGKDRSLAREFPDLKVEQRTAPCSNGMRGSTARRVPPSGMKRFPVGHSHKQGLELIIPGTDLQWMGGKKT